MAKGVQLDGAQFCIGYQNQKKNIQGARRFQSFKCLVIGISTLLTNPIELALYTSTLIFLEWVILVTMFNTFKIVKLVLQTFGFVLEWDIHTNLEVTQKNLVV
jgi:hypothetical protein